MSDATQAPRSGWYPDPQVPDRMRFWDGSTWTEQTYALEPRRHPVGYRFAVLAQVIRAGLVLSLVIGLAEIALYVWGLSMFDAAVATGDIDRLSRFDDLNSVLTISEVAVFLVTGIVWMFWQYQLARSARPGELERSPGMHVGSWFIPLANLVLVFQNIRDLWRRFVGTTTSLLGWWWATTLLANFVIRLGTPDENDYSVGSLQTQVSFWMASSVFGVVSAALALVIVRRLTFGGLANSAPGASGMVDQTSAGRGKQLPALRQQPPEPPSSNQSGTRIF